MPHNTLRGTPLNHPLTRDRLNDGLVFWWKGLPGLTEGEYAYDLTPFKNHGQLTNMDPNVAWVDDPRGGRALDFDGSDDHVVGPTLTVPITVMAWFRYRGSGNRRIWQFGANRNSANVDSSHRLVGYYNGTTLGLFTGVAANVWHLAAVSYDGTNGHVYLDNRVRLSAVASVYGGAEQLLIGSTTGAPNQIFDGQISDVRIYNRALPPTEVKDVYLDSLNGYARTLR